MHFIYTHINLGELFNYVIGPAFGSAAGAAVVVMIANRKKARENKTKNFNIAISIQIALSQMLNNVLLPLYKRGEESKKSLQEKFPLHNPQELWEEFKFIALPTLYNFHSFIELNWDLSQFLSIKASGTRQLLNYIIPARAGYTHINSLINLRNDLCNEAYKKISLSDANQKINS